MQVTYWMLLPAPPDRRQREDEYIEIAEKHYGEAPKNGKGD